MDTVSQWVQIYMVLVSFPVAMVKYPDKNILRGKGVVLAHSPRAQSTVAGTSR